MSVSSIKKTTIKSVKTCSRAAASLGAMLLCLTAAAAADRVIIVTGTGPSPAQAIADAIQKGGLAVNGGAVTTRQRLENDRFVEDQVTAVTKAFTTNYSIEQTRVIGRQIEVTLRLQVDPTRWTGKLEKLPLPPAASLDLKQEAAILLANEARNRAFSTELKHSLETGIWAATVAKADRIKLSKDGDRLRLEFELVLSADPRGFAELLADTKTLLSAFNNRSGQILAQPLEVPDKHRRVAQQVIARAAGAAQAKLPVLLHAKHISNWPTNAFTDQIFVVGRGTDWTWHFTGDVPLPELRRPAIRINVFSTVDKTIATETWQLPSEWLISSKARDGALDHCCLIANGLVSFKSNEGVRAPADVMVLDEIRIPRRIFLNATAIDSVGMLSVGLIAPERKW